MYFSGKALAKFAYICLSTSDVLRDTPLTRTCLTKLKVHSQFPHPLHPTNPCAQTAFNRFASNAQQNALVYETQWRGVISDALYKTGDPNVDFGSGYYNDHHFRELCFCRIWRIDS